MPEELEPTPDPTPEGGGAEEVEYDLPDEPQPEGGAEGGTAAPEDPYQEWGGRDTVQQAVELHKALQTEDGVWNMFFQAGRALGLGVREIEALFAAQGGTPPSQEDGPSMPADDDVLTYAEFKRLMEEQVLRPQQEQQRIQQEYVARQTIDATCQELGVTDPAIREAILQLGDRYLGDDISPKNVAEAVRKGHQDYLKVVQAEMNKYRKQKREQAGSVPKSPTGGPPGPATSNEPEPRDVAEAIRRARARRAQMAS